MGILSVASRTSVVLLTLTFQRTIFSTEYGSLRFYAKIGKYQTDIVYQG